MRRLPFRSVGIVGLGQIGGSLALALHGACPSLAIHGADPGARGLPSWLRACRSADRMPPVDLLVLACPVPGILRVLEAMRGWRTLPGAVTDVGSVKVPVVRAMARLPGDVAWIGGHPLAGTEGRGWAAASADRFRGARWVLTRERRGQAGAEALARAAGARPAVLPAARHDRILARTSHALYVVSRAIVRAARAEGFTAAELGRFSAGGWRDMTRLAGSDPRMAEGYVRTNAREVAEALRALGRELRGPGGRYFLSGAGAAATAVTTSPVTPPLL